MGGVATHAAALLEGLVSVATDEALAREHIGIPRCDPSKAPGLRYCGLDTERNIPIGQLKSGEPPSIPVPESRVAEQLSSRRAPASGFDMTKVQ